MKILIVASQNKGKMSLLVVEQYEALRRAGCVVDTYGVIGHGIMGYIKNIAGLRLKIKQFEPDIVHAHYGLSGLLATMQTKVPVVTTYHGSDIHTLGLNLRLSKIAMRRSAFNVFVSDKLRQIANYTKKDKYDIVPCGINENEFVLIEREIACSQLNWKSDKKRVLFSGPFDREVKNAVLAKSAMKLVPEAQLIELKGFSRKEVQLAMNACNCLLMTSFREGSPTVIKEAMACGTPIVSVDVGDVKAVTNGTTGCYISESYDADELALLIRKAISFVGKTNGRQRIVELGLSNELIARRLINIYNKILNK